MKTSNFKILFLILFCFKSSNSSENSNGSHCQLKSGAYGTCQDWNNCEIIKDLWAKKAITRAHVTECDKYKKTICCPDSLENETTTPEIDDERATTRRKFIARTRTPTTTEPTTTEHVAIQSTKDKNQERISQIKCKEYGEAVYKIIKLTPILGHKPRESKISKCAHKFVSLIIGGNEASIDEFPHQALLGYSPRNRNVTWACGGSLVSPSFVLTAAHCLFDRTLGRVKKVKLGMRNKDEEHDNRRVFVYNVKEKFEHPNYNDQTFNEDIALLKLDGTVPINEHILPICLPTTQHEDFKAIATGFGRLQSQGKQSDTLMKVNLERFTHTECKASYPEDGNVKIIEDTMICYGHHKERKDICKGDSGGPLQVSNDNNIHCTYTQIGISSFGPYSCGTIKFPSGFTNVYNYLDWIENIVWKDEQ